MPSYKNYRLLKPKRGDAAILLIACGLSLFGLLMISSASVVVSFDRFGTNNVYLIRQAVYFLVGMLGLIITSLIDYRVWKKLTLPILVTLFLFLLAVHIPGIGTTLGGARRWISFGSFLFQPSEFFKIATVIYLAAWLEKKGKEIESFRLGIVPFGVFLGVVVLMIMNQPDMGTALVIILISVIMVFAAGALAVHLTAGLLLGSSLFYLLVRGADYRWQRFLTFLNPGADLQGAGYQVNQALLAIGSGGWLGLGFGQSYQKYLYLPQVQTDAIFAVMVEEFGFVRVVLVLAVFLYFGIKGIAVAKRAPDVFGRLMAAGITGWILIQAFINIAGVMGLVPLTGIPLPFISYGGSSLIALLSSVGILYNISKHNRLNESA